MLTGKEKLNGKYDGKASGFTIIEMLAVTTIAAILLVMAAGSIGNTKRFSIEERVIVKLRQLADLQERYRFSSDPTANPEGTYATFEELQLAGYIADDLEEDDVRAHTVNAFLPYYRLEITRSPNNPSDEPDANSYYIIAFPIPTRWNLKTYHMIEDGEVWHSYGLKYYER